ncbi:MAG: NADPH:quinone reductase [bacterium]|nr:NADPH:quinone reductase [bacterium]
MKAAWYEKYGPAKEVIKVGELDAPEAGPGEVRVRMYASGVNPSDVKARVGSRGPFKDKLIVPHSDGAGVIDQVGSGVDPSREGERVWVYNGQWERPMGTNAEYIVLPERQAVPLPDSVSFAEGACLAIPAMTAHRCLFSDGGIQGQTVLVTGGAGAVGNYAVQLAKWAGAHVIATISSGEKAARAREAGASHTINYRSEDVAARIDMITNGEGVDRIVDVDFGTNLRFSIDSLKHNGMITTYASMGNREPAFPHYPAMQRNTNIRWVFVYAMPDEAIRRACEDIVAAIEQEALTHPVAVTYPLEETAASHEMVESGAYMGNVVVMID